MRAWLIVLAALGALGTGVASADPPRGAMLVQPDVHTAAGASPILYLNRCTGGCTVHGSANNDATTMSSSIPCIGTVTCGTGACFCSELGGTFTIGEFQDAAGEVGTAADAEWAQLLACVQQVYSPYAVTVTDQVQDTGLSYTEGIVAGLPADIGYGGAGIGGIASGPNSDCSPQSDVISFTFANLYSGPTRLDTLCGVVGQETAHAFGLDHEYSFVDMTSACKDPMSYRDDCGGQRFFRNEPAQCGEYATRTCKCGGLQNSHLKILSVFGPATPITTPPDVAVISPADGDTVTNGQAVQVSAGAQRGVASVELWLNGYNWASVPGAGWTQNGQPDPSSYALTFPATVPDGIIDIVVKAYDDLQIETDTPTITVTKGAPCTDATTCATGQVCDSGKCLWNPATGVLGDPCTYPQFCTSGICQGTADQQICTESCVAGAVGACPMGYDCIATSDTGGICFPTDSGGGGCCTVAGDAGGGWISGGLGAIVLGFVIRRRRR